MKKLLCNLFVTAWRKNKVLMKINDTITSSFNLISYFTVYSVYYRCERHALPWYGIIYWVEMWGKI
jgi:hypothetical protein